MRVILFFGLLFLDGSFKVFILAHHTGFLPCVSFPFFGSRFYDPYVLRPSTCSPLFPLTHSLDPRAEKHSFRRFLSALSFPHDRKSPVPVRITLWRQFSFLLDFARIGFLGLPSFSFFLYSIGSPVFRFDASQPRDLCDVFPLF